MERRVKERLIGASILVVMVVLVVPELLSGPKQAPSAPPEVSLPRPASSALEPVRNVTVDLATSKPPSEEADPAGASVAAPASSASAAPSPPVPEPESSPPPKPEPHPPSAPSTNSAPKYPVPTAQRNVESAAPIPTSGTWNVQLGSFISRGNADGLVQKVRAEGFPAFLSPIGSGKGERYRVRVGPVSDRNAAERMVSKLKGAKHDGTVVAPGR